jgi:hypothetical protein
MADLDADLWGGTIRCRLLAPDTPRNRPDALSLGCGARPRGMAAAAPTRYEGVRGKSAEPGLTVRRSWPRAHYFCDTARPGQAMRVASPRY